ncbi:MAG: hypothetical protein HW378_4581 [Anaerolineales bacterium]|nr:hypothetical protein [Anaerolineales bacterium]
MSKRKRHSREGRPAARPTLAPPPAEPSQRPSSFLSRLLSSKSAGALLREKIMDFVYQPRFGKDFEQAIRLYFGKAALRGRTLTVDEEEMPGFQEWYVHDFVTTGGRQFIDRFAEEVGPSLPEAEAKLLAAWRAMNCLRLFEIQSVQPGASVSVRDLLSDEEITIHDHSASRIMRRWMVILARPHQAEDRVCFTGSSPALTPMYKREMLESAQKLWNGYRARQPEAAFSDFYRAHSLDLLLEMKRLQEEASRPPVLVTAEGHSLMEARAEYAVRNANAVGDRLSEAEEFNFAGPSEEHRDALHFNWLLRGRSRVPEKPMPAKGALALRTDWTAGPGEPAYRSLGDIMLWKDRLELECMSRERLEAGKTLLAEVLGDLAKHKRDRVKPLKIEAASPYSETATAPQRPAPRRRLSREEMALEREMLERTTLEWLDSPAPTLNNLSPRQAVNTPEGRAEVLEMLKVAEYLDDNRRASGEPPVMDIDRIRRELGLLPA